MGRPQTKRVRIVDTTPQHAHGYDGRALAEKGYARLYRQRPDMEGNNGGWPTKDYEAAALPDVHTNGDDGATSSSMRARAIANIARLSRAANTTVSALYASGAKPSGYLSSCFRMIP